jgi:hypothetical protein
MTKTLIHAALLATACLIAPTAPALAQTEAASTALSASAQRFGALYVPIDLSLESAIAGFNKEFEPAIRADANVVALDQRFPGLIDVAGKAGRNAMESAMRRELPATQQRIAALAGARFTIEELDAINAYLASPEGQKLQRVMAETADGSALSNEMRATGEVPQLDGAKLLAMVNPAALGRLNKAELASLIKFSASPAGRKFDATGGELAELVASEMNNIIAAMKPDIEQAVVGAITAHLGKK